MEFLTLRNRTVNIELLPSKYPVRDKLTSKSNSQHSLGKILQSIYKGYVILEEFGIPDSRLSLDFFIPLARIAFEYQGEQHDKFNKFFHGTSAAFKKQRERDMMKREWCELNNITLIEVRSSDLTIDNIKKLILDE